MKSKKRHDLETNELARHAAVWIEKIKPYSAQLLGAAVVLAGIAVLGSTWSSVSQSQQEEAWNAYALAINANDLEMFNLQRVASDEVHEGTSMQEWALVTWADRQLTIATKTYFTDRESTSERLNRIASIYERLAENAGDEQILGRARYGLGRTYEMQNRLEDARQQFDLVRGDFEALARDRADFLFTPEAQEDYQWLSTVDLPKFPVQGATGSRPEFEAELPSTGLDARSLEEILGLSPDNQPQDRYQADAPATEPEEGATEDSSSEVDEIFEDEQVPEGDVPETGTGTETDTEAATEP